MNISLNLFQTGFGAYSSILPGRAACKAVEWMTSPRITRERRLSCQELFSEHVALPSGARLSSYGNGNKKILFLHGWSGWVGQFEGLIREINPFEYTVYAIQPLGHGESRAVRSHPGRFIEASLEAIEYLDSSFDVAIGHSLGAAALVSVQALTESFERMVLISSPATIEGVLNRFARFLNLGKRSKSHFITTMEETVGIPVEELNLLLIAEVEKVPVLLIHDEDDQEIPVSESESLSLAFDNSQIFRTAGWGHSRLLQNPEVTQKIMHFLDNTSSHFI
ncbi:Pimeloyl-ACP methyl ester carboxylesterase [Marinobacter sp. es.048]|uniref:alpha/beta fold hydrolase n=1 Tax=Marinobacter sp. es.048 TaxID=1761795 RepID=UPI000B5897D3|nr:alpha/beta hydrolase [Marinobacter sp. es.048]SNC74661.1 Pimeloyl-ACP methyl ester carboxylesterase [Marinobacter sp. es.048]